ncbi:hypothetical protein R3P38DRAFT_3264064 [Favolaschia claudopus]|uniref:Uncharacterized protein n=1 Tax=Favolaschia claudopus TaxID=2862362 RepID=A0AAW0C5A8_9AGAR
MPQQQQVQVKSNDTVVAGEGEGKYIPLARPLEDKEVERKTSPQPHLSATDRHHHHHHQQRRQRQRRRPAPPNYLALIASLRFQTLQSAHVQGTLNASPPDLPADNPIPTCVRRSRGDAGCTRTILVLQADTNGHHLALPQNLKSSLRMRGGGEAIATAPSLHNGPPTTRKTKTEPAAPAYYHFPPPSGATSHSSERPPPPPHSKSHMRKSRGGPSCTRTILVLHAHTNDDNTTA